MFEIPSNKNVVKCIISKETIMEQKEPKMVIEESQEQNEKSDKKRA